jgi:16S rRNA (guanine966-N2)-methyltransferase
MKNTQRGAVRIIGGKWKRHYLHFPTHLLVKPTPNRVRETLFNWLQGIIQGAVCLDLFAGSGALGFEALSRGAAWVSFVENSIPVAQAIQKQLIAFKANKESYVHAHGYSELELYHCTQLTPHAQKFDVIFLDPPFHKGLIRETLYWLETQKEALNPEALLYIEHEPNLEMPDILKKQWSTLHQKRAGQVHYGLWKRL